MIGWIVAVVGLICFIASIFAFRKAYIKEKDEIGLLFLFTIAFGFLFAVGGTAIAIMSLLK